MGVDEWLMTVISDYKLHVTDVDYNPDTLLGM